MYNTWKLRLYLNRLKIRKEIHKGSRATSIVHSKKGNDISRNLIFMVISDGGGGGGNN